MDALFAELTLHLENGDQVLGPLAKYKCASASASVARQILPFDNEAFRR